MRGRKRRRALVEGGVGGEGVEMRRGGMAVAAAAAAPRRIKRRTGCGVLVDIRSIWSEGWS